MEVGILKKIKQVILILMSGILITTFLSGCINPVKEVPIIKVNITYTERQGIAEVDTYSFIQDNVSYINRPKRTQAESFPAIIGRTTIIKKVMKDNDKVNETVIGPWEAIPYKGNGRYSLDVGFYDGNYPEPGDMVHISIMVVDKNGERIGYVIENIVWK